MQPQAYHRIYRLWHILVHSITISLTFSQALYSHGFEESSFVKCKYLSNCRNMQTLAAGKRPCISVPGWQWKERPWKPQWKRRRGVSGAMIYCGFLTYFFTSSISSTICKVEYALLRLLVDKLMKKAWFWSVSVGSTRKKQSHRILSKGISRLNPWDIGVILWFDGIFRWELIPYDFPLVACIQYQ